MTKYVALLKRYENIDNFLVFINNQEIFIKNSFENFVNLTIAQKDNTQERYEVLLNLTNLEITKKFNFYGYMREHSIDIATTHQQLISLGHQVSWLQIMQVLQIQKQCELSVKEAYLKLEEIYKKLL